MIQAVWLGGRNLCWDQHWISEMLEHPSITHSAKIPEGCSGCVLVVPARYHEAAEIQAMIAPLEWVVVVLTSDEESTFDHRALNHPNMRLWVMTPRPDRHDYSPRLLVEGRPSDTSALLSPNREVAQRRPLDVFFAGQVTHERREACVEAMATLPDDWRVETLPTEGFTQGLDRADYLAVTAAAKIVPCPSGPATPDSFRVFEALEACSLPIADGLTPDPNYPADYWPLVVNGAPPFPVLSDWGELHKEIEHARRGWPLNAAQAAAWWQAHKRTKRNLLRDDAAELSGEAIPEPSEITVVIPTSPVPSNPSTEIIAETIASVREQLPTAEILVMADGVRAEQMERRKDYHRFLLDLVWRCAHDWSGVTPFISSDHQHQGNLTRWALEQVRTPLILFVEHDTPLCGEIPWAELSEVVQSGVADVVRFHHEAHVLAPHRHLMLDSTPQIVGGVPLLRTAQWSQRPHLASTGFYRTMIQTYFGVQSRTMIEDVMHGVVESAFRTHKVAGWQQFRLWMYAPGGDMKRSLHLDGRGEDPKFDMIYAYDGEVPEGAPRPCA